MPEPLDFAHNGQLVDVVVEDELGGARASDKAGVGEFLQGTTRKVKVSLHESVVVLGQIASAFSASLANSDPKPANVEINFGLEASGEAGNFIISKISGKSNFSVKMTWKFE